MATGSMSLGERLARYRSSVKVIRRVKMAVVYLLLAVFAYLVLIPLVWMVSTSLKTHDQVFTWPIQWIPNPVVWANYPATLAARPFVMWTRNTLIIACLSVLGHLFSASVVGYAFSRLRWPGRDIVFLVMLSTMMLPEQVTLIPQFIVFGKLGWVNTFLPLFAPTFFGGAFNIFLMRQFMITLPVELDDAARLDGCGIFGILTRITLPLSKPALGIIAINTFRARWNAFFHPLIYLNDPKLFTLALGLRSFRSEFAVEWSYLMAASVMAMLPLIVTFFIAQRYFIQGIVFTGVKG